MAVEAEGNVAADGDVAAARRVAYIAAQVVVAAGQGKSFVKVSLRQLLPAAVAAVRSRQGRGGQQNGANARVQNAPIIVFSYGSSLRFL